MKKTPIVPEKGVDIFKLLKVLRSLKPLFEDSTNYPNRVEFRQLEIYKNDITKLFKILHWDV